MGKVLQNIGFNDYGQIIRQQATNPAIGAMESGDGPDEPAMTDVP